MPLQNPLFCVVIYAVAFFTAYLIQLRYKPQSASVRYETIDGLRGFLALGVFIHHSVIWHQYLHTDIWIEPSSNLFNHLGKTSVSFFFMITSFLFVNKLIESKKIGFNWKGFLISRIFRLFPVYYIALFTFFVLIFYRSNWQINVSTLELAQQLKHWLLFTIKATPEINNVQNTYISNAGVIWSLPYEWLFYFSLPILSLIFIKKKPPVVVLIISIAFIYYYLWKRVSIEQDIFFYSFIGGAIASLLKSYSKIREIISKKYISVLIIICIASIILFIDSTTNYISIVISSVVFICIALGNSVFGLLKLPYIKLLGDVSYSTYLIHGIILFVVMNIGLGYTTVSSFTTIEYSILIILVTPIIVIVSYLFYRFVELPFIKIGKKLSNKNK